MDALAQAEKRADSSVQLGVDLKTRTLELARINDELDRFKKAVHVSCVHIHSPSTFFFVARLRLYICRGILVTCVIPFPVHICFRLVVVAAALLKNDDECIY